MRIMYMDDERIRHDEANRLYAGHEIVHTYTAQEALAALAGPKFDLVSLDHDLGNRKWPGMKVSDAIAKMPEGIRPNEVIVHSWNPPAARIMVATLREAGIKAWYIPFTCDKYDEVE